MHELLATPVTKIRFTFQDFAKVFGLSIGLTALFIALFSFFPGATEFMGGMHPSLSFLFTYLIQFAILFFPLWFFVIDRYDSKLKDFGFKKVKPLSFLGNVILVYGAYLLFALAFGVLVYVLGLELPGYGQQESYVPFFGDDALGLAVGVLFVVFVAPFIEELYFRGFIYRTFTKTWPVYLGSVATAIVFAFVHLQLEAFIPLFIVGLFLNWAYERTKSVWVAVGFHMLNNAVAFSMDVYLYHHPELLESIDTFTAFILH